MIYLAYAVSALMLAPLFLYLIGRIRDPFNPLIFLGTMAFFVNPQRLISHTQAALELLPAETYTTFLWVCAVSMLGIYAGWFAAARNRRTRRIIENGAAAPPAYDMSRWVIVALVFAVLGVTFHFATVDALDVSGYLRDLRMLWITSAILLVQFYRLAKSPMRVLAFLPLMVALTPPFERFANYGQRGDTFRVAAIVALGYLVRYKRPSKAAFLCLGLALALVLSTIQFTRGLIEDGRAKNRVDALLMVIPAYLGTEDLHRTNGAEEYIFGAAGVQTVRDTGRYGYGTGITIGFLDHLAPRFLFPQKDFGIIQTSGIEGDTIRADTGNNISYGSAPGGFAHGFFELGWFCPAVWFIFAYIYRLLWDRMRLSRDPMYQGLFIGYTMAMLYAVTQDILTAEVNIMYSFVPLFLVYKISRYPSVVPQAEPLPLLHPSEA